MRPAGMRRMPVLEAGGPFERGCRRRRRSRQQAASVAVSASVATAVAIILIRSRRRMLGSVPAASNHDVAGTRSDVP